MLGVLTLETLLRHARREQLMSELDAPSCRTCPHCGGVLGAEPVPPPVSPTPPPAPAPGRVERVLAVAEGEWRRGIIEPPAGGDASRERIELYITSMGWSPGEVNLKERGQPYRNGGFAWCGCFAGWVYLQCGFAPQMHERVLRLRPEYHRKPLLVMSSTARLMEWAQGTDRLLKPREARPGDLTLVGSKHGKWYGDHIQICRGVTSTGVLAFDGNAVGRSAAGERVEGVVQTKRPFTSDDPDTYIVKHVIRPLPADWKE